MESICNKSLVSTQIKCIGQTYLKCLKAPFVHTSCSICDPSGNQLSHSGSRSVRFLCSMAMKPCHLYIKGFCPCKLLILNATKDIARTTGLNVIKPECPDFWTLTCSQSVQTEVNIKRWRDWHIIKGFDDFENKRLWKDYTWVVLCWPQCLLDICWKRAKFKGKMLDQSVHSLLIPHSIELIYLKQLQTHTTCGLPLSMLHIWQFAPTYVAEGLYYCSCSAKRSPHEAKRERVGEERTKPVSPTHTSLLSSLKELLYSPTWRSAKAVRPAKNKLTFIDRVRMLFGKRELAFVTGQSI